MQEIENLRNIYNEFANKENFNKYIPKELYEPMDYILALGGKQMRPVLLLMAARLFDESAVKKALPAAYAIELFHNFSLIHDDIMDAAPMRRGKPTVHIKYGVNTAILSGDVMLVHAYQYLAACDNGNLAELLRIFNETAIAVCEGQQMDMNFETSKMVKLEEYIRMIELKTSVLLHGAMKIGALCAAASASDAAYIGEFGRTMGIAFQLQDDLLDGFGDQATFGKRIGGDIVQNKKTFLYLKAMELGNTVDTKTLNNWYNNPIETSDEADKIETVKSIFLSSGAVNAIENEIENYRNKALDALAKISVPEQNKALLLNFLNYIMQRQY